ncbi:unnamed protein product [Didymodactylos carnosus]|uniref:ZZ-type domain-containing protein n=1 Tax=Didymodactylos carnosus TaxID=1234261 RepID=A0A8S2P0J3_9BILA|nr:unnamed protein product [Didymodactylos carnosus]CAF4021684.1 unnamed protein product [Didymodactylos carnosus]
MSKHIGFVCSSCKIKGFLGERYKCEVCYDYDLCQLCYFESKTTRYHLKSHHMKCIDVPLQDCIDIKSNVRTAFSFQIGQRNKKQVNFPYLDADDSTLHAAVLSENLSTIKSVLDEKSVDINKTNYRLETPLHYASAKHLYNVVQLLLKYEDCNVNCKDYYGCTSLHRLLNVVDDSNNDISLLVDCLIKSNPLIMYTHNIAYQTPMDCMLDVYSHNIISIFIQNGYQPNIAYLPHGRTDLHTAVFENKVDMIEVLLNFGWNPNEKDRCGKIPLHYISSLHSACKIIELLCFNGCNINIQDSQGNTPLNTFVSHCSIVDPDLTDLLKYKYEYEIPTLLRNTIECFLQHGADMNIENIYGHNPAYNAIRNQIKSDILLYMISHLNEPYRCRNKSGCSLLHWAIAYNRIEIIEELIVKYQFNPQTLDNSGANALFYTDENMFETVQYLILNGVDPFAFDQHGLTAVKQAQYFGFTDILRLYNAEGIDRYPIRSFKDVPRPTLSPADFTRQVINSPYVGSLPSNIDEINEIKHAVQLFMNYLSTTIIQLDKRFQFQPQLSGSMMEQTKIGLPNEFDYMCDLELFKILISNVINYCDNDEFIRPPDGFARIICSNGIRPDLDEYTYKDQLGITLMPLAIVYRFKDLLSVILSNYKANINNLELRMGHLLRMTVQI